MWGRLLVMGTWFEWNLEGFIRTGKDNGNGKA